LDYDEVSAGIKVPEQSKVPSHESVFQFILMLLDEFKVIDVVDVKLYNSYVNSVLNDITTSVVRKHPPPNMIFTLKLFHRLMGHFFRPRKSM
jgi:hypothetical protein